MGKTTAVRIQLHSKRYPGFYALVDQEDADMVSQYRWYVGVGRRLNGPPVYYAWTHMKTHKDRPMVQLHRFILGLRPSDPDVDHKDGDGLNCQRSNIRVCSDSQNQANRQRTSNPNATSRYRGVTWHKQCQKWQAGIKVMGKNHHLGLFDSEVGAALAYNAAAIQHFGEFASLNVVEREAAA